MRRGGFSFVALLIAVAIVAAAALAIVVVFRTDTRGTAGSGLGKDFTYDVSAFRKVDPALVKYREVRSIPVGLDGVGGLARDGAGRLYVAADGKVRILDASGAVLSDIATRGRARCVAVDDDGTLFVGVFDHIEVYDPKGKLKASWKPPDKDAFITGIALAEENVFAIDPGAAVVYRYDRSGKLLKRIGRKDPERNIPGLVFPSLHGDLAVGPEGLLWVTNCGRFRVEGYTFDGDLEVHWGKRGFGIEGFCGCCNPTNLAILREGLFVTSEKGIPRVKVCDLEGKVVEVVAPPGVFDKDAVDLDLATDPDGRVYVLDPETSTIRVFERSAR